MGRRYLNGLGIKSKLYTKDKERSLKWKKERMIYGFDERDTWDMEYYFHVWLYERLKMYLDRAGEIVNLDFNRFEYEGKSYTQRQLIKKMLVRIEFRFSHEDWDFSEENSNYVREVNKIWALVAPAMWW